MLSFESIYLFSFPYCIRECITNHLRRILHHDIVSYARGRTIHFPCNACVAVILVIQLVHPDQFFRCNSRSHGLLGGLGRTRCGFQLGIGMLHCLAPAFIDVAAERLDLRVGAAEFFDHAVDFFQLCSVVPRYSDGFLVGIQYDLHGISPLNLAFSVETLR